MVRLTRAQTQERTRSGVLAAARAEFAAHGYRDATIDGIAARAGLTRGAVYANFAGKRSLYLSVLAADAERAARSGDDAVDVRSPQEALAAIARVRLSGAEIPAEVLDDDRIRTAHAQLLTLEALVLGLALERLGRRGRGVRVAVAALTLLAGAGRLAAGAPGFADPFDVVAACELLAGLPPDRGGPRPHLAHVASARLVDEPWPDETWPDGPAPPDGVVHVLGPLRLEAAEESVRAAPAGTGVTVALVTGTPDDLAPLTRLVLARLDGTLRRAIPGPARPPLRLLHGPEAARLAAAAGVADHADDTEAAVRVAAGRIVARASGRGAGHAAATAAVTRDAARRPA